MIVRRFYWEPFELPRLRLFTFLLLFELERNCLSCSSLPAPSPVYLSCGGVLL